jgi:hypothetical protein
MEQYAAQIFGAILGAIVIGLLMWIASQTQSNGRDLVAIKTRLFGDEREDGGGLAGDIKHLRNKTHDHADKLHEHGLRLGGLEDRVTRLEVEDE